jgi:hypothetical protein
MLYWSVVMHNFVRFVYWGWRGGGLIIRHENVHSKITPSKCCSSCVFFYYIYDAYRMFWNVCGKTYGVGLRKQKYQINRKITVYNKTWLVFFVHLCVDGLCQYVFKSVPREREREIAINKRQKMLADAIIT